MSDDRARWQARWAERGDRPPGEPSAWVLRQTLALPPNSLVVDVASGDGRHAIPLAAAGLRVVAIDLIEGAVRAARRHEPRVRGVVADAARLPIRAGSADGVLCVNFLDRALFPHLASLLRPGGRLVVETFCGDLGPRNPAFRLRPGELPTLVAPLRVLESYEADGRAGVVADRAAGIG